MYFDFILARASPCPTSLLYDNLSTARFSRFIDSQKRTSKRSAFLLYINNYFLKKLTISLKASSSLSLNVETGEVAAAEL